MQALSELFFQFESTEFQREESSIIQQTLTRVNAKVDSSLEREETLIEKTLARVRLYKGPVFEGCQNRNQMFH